LSTNRHGQRSEYAALFTSSVLIALRVKHYPMTETEANANIAKLMAETERLSAETATLNAELARTIAETRHLNAEIPKFQVEAVNLGVLRGKLYLEIIFYPLVVFSAWLAAVLAALKVFGLLKV
jgi:hypothetical protein